MDFPTKQVLHRVRLGLADGDRVGLVGRNGDGKSTLLRLLAKRISPDEGQVVHRNGLHVGYLDQGDVLPDGQSVRHAVVGDVDDYVWASDPRIRDILDGLIADLDLDADVATLSGGQRRRVALAALLIGDWDVIMLDEPTNHLDVEGISWLARHVKNRWAAGKGALVVVTHDRWFLDEVCTATWEVHDRIVDPFEGGYAAYVLQRVERDRQAAAAEARRQNLMRKELAWLRRGAPARTSKPKFRIDAASQLIAGEPPVRDQVELSKLATARLGKDVVDLEHVAVSFDGREVLRDVTWRIGPGDRFALLGANGVGKSTLLKVITGDVTVDHGRVKRGKTVRTAVLSQQLHELDAVAHERISDVIGRYRAGYISGDKELTPGQLLERLGFTSAQLATPIKDLSGGQRRRLQLLLILLDEPNVLILDEPTNDLDTDMLAAMEDLLDTWPGTMLVASHDRYLLERVTDHQYAIIDGRIRHLPGGVDEYLRLAEAGSGAGARSVADAAAAPSVVSGSSAAPELSSAELRAARKEVEATERRMQRQQATIDRLHTEMADHDPNDYTGLAALHDQLRTAEDELATLETAWLELAEQLE
ncbi:ABC-F family ATP-binding cassette domain-containing protein [Propionibacteriaceae bacterium Y2011]